MVWEYKKLTSHGGGALRYDGTILNVTDPRASRWKLIKEKLIAVSNSIDN